MSDVVTRVSDMAMPDVRLRMREQHEKHGGDTNIGLPLEWIGLMLEELGEAAEAANHFNWTDPSEREAEQEAFARFQDELLDVAALAIWAVAWCLNDGRSNVRPS